MSKKLTFEATFVDGDGKEYVSQQFYATSWQNAVVKCLDPDDNGIPSNHDTLVSLDLVREEEVKNEDECGIWYPLMTNGVYTPYLYSTEKGLDQTRICPSKQSCQELCEFLNNEDFK